MRQFIFAFGFVLAALAVTQVQSKTLESIGEVTYLRGVVTRMPHGSIDETALKAKDPIFAKDYIISKKASVVRLTLSDKTVLTLGPNGRLNLARYEFRKGEHRTSLYRLVSGKLRAVMEKQDGESSVVVETKTAALAIRGTEFVIDGQVNEKKEQVIQIVLLEGKLQITDKVTSKSYPLLPGEAYLTVINSTNSNYNSSIFDMNRESVQKLAAASSRILDSIVPPGTQADGELALGAAAPSAKGEAELEGMFIETSPSLPPTKLKGADPKLKKRLQELDKEWK